MQQKNLTLLVEVNEDVNEDDRKDFAIYQLHSEFGKKFIVRIIPLAQKVLAPFSEVELFMSGIRQFEFNSLQKMYAFMEEQLFIKSGVVKFIDKPRDAKHPFETVVLRQESSRAGTIRVKSADVGRVIEILDGFFSSEMLEIAIDAVSGCCK